MKRNVLNSPRLLKLKKKRRIIFLVKILFFLFGFALILIGLIYVSRISALNISEMKIIGNEVVDAEMIKATVQETIEGHYLWFFPRTNILFYPANDIKNKLFNEFKRLKDISFSMKNNKILEISVSERTALYTWCGDIMPENENKSQKCYFMDESGYIFDEAPYFSGNIYFKFYGTADVGTFFSKENFNKLTDFQGVLTAIGFKPISLSILDNGNIKIFLSSHDQTSVEPYLIFKIDSDFKNIAENLEAALTTEPLKSDFKNKYSSLLYIDLRFGNKVYYKFK